ncbi:hypothetical protein BJV74DRAFT_802921 [Russula compacta]|nr:hypothetical protein BJV74DRAFT_802921 [Russula compacta]
MHANIIEPSSASSSRLSRTANDDHTRRELNLILPLLGQCNHPRPLVARRFTRMNTFVVVACGAEGYRLSPRVRLMEALKVLRRSRGRNSHSSGITFTCMDRKYVALSGNFLDTTIQVHDIVGRAVGLTTVPQYGLVFGCSQAVQTVQNIILRHTIWGHTGTTSRVARTVHPAHPEPLRDRICIRITDLDERAKKV